MLLPRAVLIVTAALQFPRCRASCPSRPAADNACTLGGSLAVTSVPGKLPVNSGRCNPVYDKEEFQQQPRVRYPEAKARELYTLVMVDSDALGMNVSDSSVVIVHKILTLLIQRELYTLVMVDPDALGMNVSDSSMVIVHKILTLLIQRELYTLVMVDPDALGMNVSDSSVVIVHKILTLLIQRELYTLVMVDPDALGMNVCDSSMVIVHKILTLSIQGELYTLVVVDPYTLRGELYTLVMVDPDAPGRRRGQYYLHWIVANINNPKVQTKRYKRSYISHREGDKQRWFLIEAYNNQVTLQARDFYMSVVLRDR
ncbi:hypothetical protein J6590_052211 [Homalodisca vitripennis]|nr:hypothetical protein J6590_052211 [Homalodisca vitripennis]